MNIDKLIEGAHRHKASDIHIQEDHPPFVRISGTILPTQEPAVTHDDMLQCLQQILPQRLHPVLEEKRAVDFSYQFKQLCRCRFVAFYERKKLRMVIRLISLDLPTIDELEVSPVLKRFGDYHFGMVLVTGPTGSGKSSTLAAVINHINMNYKKALITVEDPIEYMHPNKESIVAQREVGQDVRSFQEGLVHAMRQDPDIILVGEMRDIETMGTTIKASETGHLVFSTLHTTTAVQTIERIISTFPETQHEIVREQLATNLRATVTQSLVKRASGSGRYAAQEILINLPIVKKLMLEHRSDDIVSIMRSGQEGMQVFDQALANLVRENKITYDEGLIHAKDEFAYRRYVKGVAVSSDAGGILG